VVSNPGILTGGTHDDAAAAFTYDGAWLTMNTSGPYQDTLHYTYGVGDSAVVFFTGQQIQLSYLAAPGAGKMDLYIDGVKVDTIDQNSTTGWEWQKSWTSGQLAAGTHSLRLVYASGTGDWSFTSIDAVTVIP
jgi:hypothetical protein